MSFKHRTKRSPISPLTSSLAHVETLLAQHHESEALNELERLAAQHPRNYDVFAMLFEVAAQLNDNRSLLIAAERLYELEPQEPNLFNLAQAYRMNELPALSLSTYQDFVGRWPHSAPAADARRAIAKLEEFIRSKLRALEAPADKHLEAAILHERVQVSLAAGRYAEARSLAEQAMALAPTFVAPLNNISMAYFYEGRIADAIATTRRVLALHPDNFHALGNLAHSLCLLGQWDEAEAQLQKILAQQPDLLPAQQTLSVVYQMRNEPERAEQLLRAVLAQHPDYLMGRCTMAQTAMKARCYAPAAEWLKPLMHESKLRLREFRAMRIAHIALEVTRSKCSAAQSWFDMWTGVEPAQHIVKSARARCAAHRGGEALTRRELRPRSLRWRRLR
jgi:tetratricopeptide (TPR) repeat protein